MPDINDVVSEFKDVKEATTAYLRDSYNDSKKTGFRKDITIWILLGALIGCFFFYQWSHNRMTDNHAEAILRLASEHEAAIKELSAAHDKAWTDFWEEYDFEYTIEQSFEGEAYTSGDGYLSINQADIGK